MPHFALFLKTSQGLLQGHHVHADEYHEEGNKVVFTRSGRTVYQAPDHSMHSVEEFKYPLQAQNMIKKWNNKLASTGSMHVYEWGAAVNISKGQKSHRKPTQAASSGMVEQVNIAINELPGVGRRPK